MPTYRTVHKDPKGHEYYGTLDFPDKNLAMRIGLMSDSFVRVVEYPEPAVIVSED